MRRVNVSLDTLDPAKFTEITRRGRLDIGARRARARPKRAGLAVKINTVALRGVNEDEFDDLVAWCGDQGFDLVFIEVMPMGEIGGENRLDQYLPLSLVRARLRAALDPRRDRLPHRRPGALCDGARDRPAGSASSRR